jgi:hypothetical protein
LLCYYQAIQGLLDVKVEKIKIITKILLKKGNFVGQIASSHQFPRVTFLKR